MATVPQRSLTHSVAPIREEFSPVNPGALLQLTEDLQALIAEGLIVPCEDARGIVRYHPVIK